MKWHAGLILACIVVVCCSLGCERRYGPWANEVAFSEALPDIPASYGSLEAVTAIPEYPGWFQLWFEDDVGTIRIVRVQIFTNEMPADAKTIMRSRPMVEEEAEEEGAEDEG